MYNSLREAQCAASHYKGKHEPIPTWALLEIPNVMNCFLYHYKDDIWYCSYDGTPAAVNVKVLSIHGTKKMAEAFAKSHFEAAERILIGV